MIKLKSLLLENKKIIVGLITTDGQIFSSKDVTEHGDVMRKYGLYSSGVRMANRWRYNADTKTVYWWDAWTKHQGELVSDHLKHKYNVEIVHQVIIPDDNNFTKFYNLAHGLEENLEQREKNLQAWLDDTIAKAPGKDRGEKLEYLWKNDPRWAKVVSVMSKFNRYKPPNPEAYKAKFQADKYYIRFGDLPKGGKSTNWLANKPEKGISAYPAKWSLEHNRWELDTTELSDIGMATLDSLVSNFLDNKGRPIYLLHGQATPEMGYHDTEPLLDGEKIKIVKKLKPEEIWIDEFGGGDWWQLS